VGNQIKIAEKNRRAGDKRKRAFLRKEVKVREGSA
jgi:hypothetical protein